MENLYDKISTEKNAIKKYAPDVIEIPKYISDNLKYEFYDWQQILPQIRELDEAYIYGYGGASEFPLLFVYHKNIGTITDNGKLVITNVLGANINSPEDLRRSESALRQFEYDSGEATLKQHAKSKNGIERA